MLTRSRGRFAQPEGGLLAAMSFNTPEPRRRRRAESERPPKTLIVSRDCDEDSDEDEVSSVDSPKVPREENPSDEESENEEDSMNSSSGSRNRRSETESSDSSTSDVDHVEAEVEDNEVVSHYDGDDDDDDDDDDDNDDENSIQDDGTVELESDYLPDEDTEGEEDSVTTVVEDEDELATKLRSKGPELCSTLSPLHVSCEPDNDASVLEDDSAADQLLNDEDDYDPDAETEEESISVGTVESDEDELATKLRACDDHSKEEDSVALAKEFNKSLVISDNSHEESNDTDDASSISDDDSCDVQEIGDEDFDESDLAEAFVVDDDEKSSVLPTRLDVSETGSKSDKHIAPTNACAQSFSKSTLDLKEQSGTNDRCNPCRKTNNPFEAPIADPNHQNFLKKRNHPVPEQQYHKRDRNLKPLCTDLVEIVSVKQRQNEEKENAPLPPDDKVDNKEDITKSIDTISQPKKKVWREGVVRNGAWILGSKIGSGAFGIVYIGMNTRNGQLIAVKSVKMEQAVMKDIRREIKVLKSLDHVNIVRYYGAEMDKQYLHIFQEWVPGGSLTGLLAKFGPFAMTVVRNYLSQILCGLSYLHENSILHRDIKGSNILVNDYGIVKLADFGASKQIAQLHDDLMMSLTMRGTPYYMAPEVFEERYSSKADIWSVGCVTVQMITGKPPWRDLGMTNPVALFKHIDQTSGPPALGDVTDELFLSIIERFFKRKAEERPTAKQLLADPFIVYDETFDTDDVESCALFSPSVCSPIPAKHFTRRLLCSPTPQRRGRRSSFSGIASPLLSPPLPSKSRMCAAGHSPVPDMKDWPTWAKHELASQHRVAEGNVPDMVGKVISMTDSLALSDDSCDGCSDRKATTRAFVERTSSRPSESPSTLFGLQYCRSSLSSNHI